MSEEFNNDLVQFDLPKNQSSPIKVIGVGGGGSNAVNYMFEQGITGVDFVICNTDRQALENSPIPNKIQLGSTLTEGLGAGANPEIGREAAEESVEDVKGLLQKETKMAFITAGMGGGTGTGAAPVIARVAREMDILTVGIVTMPFGFEGKSRLAQAEEGIKQLREYVDSLIIINNNKLRDAYGNLGFKSGFAKADEVLASAARGIAEVITKHYMLNIDLKDAKTVLGNSGKAIMGTAVASGEDRARKAISAALDSPLLNDNKITGCKNVLLLIISGEEEITIDEIGEINDFIQYESGGNANIIMGMGEEPSLGQDISVTVIATGFSGADAQVTTEEPRKIVYDLDGKKDDLNRPTETDATESDMHTAPKEEAPKVRTEYHRSESPSLFSELEIEKSEEHFEQGESQEVENTVSEQIDEKDATEEAIYFTLDDDEEITSESQVNEGEEFEEPKRVKPVTFDFLGKSNTISNQSENTHHHEDAQQKQEERPESADGNRIVGVLDLDDESDAPDSAEVDQDKSNLESYIFSSEDEEFDFQLIHKEPESSAEEESHNSVFERSAEEFEVQNHNPANTSEADSAEDFGSLEKPISTSRVTREEERKREMEDAYEDSIEANRRRADERRARLNQFNHKFTHSNRGIEKLENEPAYKRKGVELKDTPHSSDLPRSQFTLSDDEEGSSIKTKNSFLHDNVD